MRVLGALMRKGHRLHQQFADSLGLYLDPER